MDKVTRSYGYYFEWDSATIEGRGFESCEERDQAFANALHAFGYTRPKWWQFWRWRERLPPNDLPAPEISRLQSQ